ncbi:MAG: peptidoglycan DD-metalloendopeptidase family protein [bacterium]
MRMASKQIALLVILIACTPFFVRADTASDLTNKIADQNTAISNLEKEIAGYQQQLTLLGKNKNTLANTIQTLNLESKKLNADIKVTEGKIAAENLTLESLGSSIQKTGDNIVDLKIALAKSLHEMQIDDKNSVIQSLISKQSFSALWHYNEARSAFRTGIRERTGQLSTTKNALVNHQTEVQKAKNVLLSLEAQLQDQKAINTKTQSQKNALLKLTKNQETNYQKIVAQKLVLKTQMESDLHDYESKLKYVLNPSLLPSSGSTTFIWPLDKVIITQLFGRTVSAARLYVSGSHNGVDFGAPVGTPVKAMAIGTVIGSGNTDTACPGASYGNWVFIKYDNGLSSVYGHLSLVKAASGTRVLPGDVVAYSGATGYATGPHLHVSVFPNDGVAIHSFPSKACPGKTITIPTAATNAYLDPMLYLPKSYKTAF